ncbi:hypothetical protein Ami103574_01715 [Aminipila butyrica]|uniref:Uncharacterized protein n=1 Tax=Aminipila butyrica TaxID=433296 RepID=A0A858BTK5_9FIRM|nr:hypothetical protein [Aminipila butyrica]QIB68104.1 hypothetical protein Ami103574_01715 [Aminipila butyrica]
MKIYNKKGLVFGVVWIALGVCNLIINIVSPEEFLSKQIKDVLIAVVVIMIGSSGFIRAFSKQATREDRMEDQDERNQLLALKTKALTLKIFYGCLGMSAIGAVAGYKLTDNPAWIPIFTVAAVLLGLLLLVELIVSIYYERSM